MKSRWNYKICGLIKAAECKMFLIYTHTRLKIVLKKLVKHLNSSLDEHV